MDSNTPRIAPEAADERASSLEPATPHGEAPASAQSPLAPALLDSALGETFPPGSRKPRHDGFTPEKIGDFLRALASSGIVAQAAAEVGLSASAAYAFRNRRQGRAFAAMWDAVLIHRSRARLAAEVQARSLTGCVTVRKEEGEIVSELHFHDNRLAMAVLTRLDRLAEREAPREEQLRALSEDMDAFIDCVAGGGDADAFVAERKRPAPPESAPRPPKRVDDDPELTRLARLAGCPDYLDVPPSEIEVADLDLGLRGDWSVDQWVRAYRSGLMLWLEIRGDAEKCRAGAPLQFDYLRTASVLALELIGDSPGEAGDVRPIETGDLEPDQILEWDDDQLARAWASGVIQALGDDFWDALAAGETGGTA